MTELLNTVCYTLPDALIWMVMGLILGWTIREDREDKRRRRKQ